MTSALLRRESLIKSLRCALVTDSYRFSSRSAIRVSNIPTNTINEFEISHHAKLANDWWDTNGPMKALHSMNMVRVPFIRDGLVQCPPHERTLTPLKDYKILDVGCGGGLLSEPLAKLGAKVTGIDASKELIEVAKEHCSQESFITKPTYICTTVEEHASKYSEAYDGVVASEIIEHIDNDSKDLFIKSCISALKPGGRIFFTTPNRTLLSKILVKYVTEFVIRSVPKNTHDHDKFITPSELTFTLERNDCHVEIVNGLFYYFLGNRWELVSSTVLLYALQAVKNSR